MRLHPLIPGTVALWQLQGNFVDAGPNGLDVVPVDGITNLPTTPNPFSAADDCVQFVHVDNDAKLLAPLSPLLQITGAMTVEWIMQQWRTFTFTYFACSDPVDSPSSAPDRIGHLYAIWTTSGNPEISDQHIGSSLPSPGYGEFYGNDHGTFLWSDVGNGSNPVLTPPGFPVKTHHFAYVRNAAGDWHVLRDGVKVGITVASAGANVAIGTERFCIGGTIRQGSSGSGGMLLASVRILNYARSDADILADAQFSMLSCSPFLNYRGVRIRMKG